MPAAPAPKSRDRSIAAAALACALACDLAAARPAFAAAPLTQSRVEEGSNALAKGNASQAVASFTEALADTGLGNDRRATILSDRAVAYSRLGQSKLAFEDYNRALELTPEYAPAYNDRAGLLLALGQYGEALKDLDRAVLLAPGFAAAYNNRAGAHLKLGHHGEALRDYGRAILLMPSSAAPLSGRGRTFLSLGKPHAAIRDFSRAVTVDARFASAYRSRAEAKLAVEHYTEAIEDLSRSVAFDPNNAEIYLLRGHAYLASDNTVSALKDFSRVIEIEPNAASGYRARGLANGAAGAFEEAFADLNRAIEIEPRSALAFAYRAVVYKQSKQAEIGAKDVATALRLDPELAEVLWAKAEIAEAEGNREEAVASLQAATSRKAGFRQALAGLDRLEGSGQGTGDVLVKGAGIQSWRVMRRGGQFFAMSDDYPRLRVPLEMMSEGTPKLLEWEAKKAPLKGIGVLRFSAGVVPAKAADEPIELSAIVDTGAATIIAIEPHRQGAKTSTWTWDESKVTVASVDGVTDELQLRAGSVAAAARAEEKDKEPAEASPKPVRRFSNPESRGGGWGSWSPPAKSAPKKQKTLFDLIFN